MLKAQYRFYFFLLLVLAVLLPLIVKSAFYVNVLVLILLFAYLSSCWNILGGMTGQHSFGHALFFGIGAYTSSLLFVQRLPAASKISAPFRLGRAPSFPPVKL